MPAPIRRPRTALLRCLVTADAATLQDAALVLATLPMCATGRVFVEVDDESQIGLLAAPSRMVVTWLPRRRADDRRAARPRGAVIATAVRAWATEELCDGNGVRAWLRGDYRGVQAAHECLVDEHGIDSDAVDVPERFALRRSLPAPGQRSNVARTVSKSRVA